MRFRNISFVVITIFIFNLIPAATLAYTTIKGNPRWEFRDLPVGWMLSADCSKDLPFELCEQAVIDSFETWNDVECSTMLWRYLGTTDLDHNDWGGFGWKKDNINLMVWMESNWPADLQGAIAVTAPIFYGRDPGSFEDTDIMFNGHHFRWGVDGNWQRMDVAHIATHEIGHALGLDHSAIGQATMYYSTMQGATHSRTLHADDIEGICSIYPAGSVDAQIGSECDDICKQAAGFYCANFNGEKSCTHACDDNLDCPDDFICVETYQSGKSCWAEGDGKYNDPCKKDWDCEKGHVCRNHGFESICTLKCPSPCPNNSYCQETSAGDQACMPPVLQYGEDCSDAYCADDMVCIEFAGGHFCTYKCINAMDCPSLAICSYWDDNRICWDSLNPDRAIIEDLTSSPEDYTLEGQMVIFEAHASSPNEVRYEFLIKEPGEDQKIIREFNSSKEFYWKADSKGKYEFSVQVVDSESKAAYEDEKTITFNVVDSVDDIPDGDTITDGDNGSSEQGEGGCNQTAPSSALLLMLILTGIYLKRVNLHK